MYKKSATVVRAVGFTLAFSFGMALAAKADTLQSYNFAWSGAASGNGASATGVMTLDLTTLPNPSASGGSGLSGSDYVDIFSDITSLSVTVTGWLGGNGTFTLANLAPYFDVGRRTYWNTNGMTLKMQFSPVATPEPGTLCSVLLCLGWFAGMKRLRPFQGHRG